jgi:type I restriction enzyme S subunit
VARRQFTAAATGVTRFGLRYEAISDVTVPIHPLAAQRAIADFLDTETARIDAVIAKKREMIELIEERWRSECVHSVLHGLDPITGEGRVPDGWAIVRLGVLLALHRGFDLPTDTRRDGPIPVISSGGISGSHSERACDGPGVVTGRYGTIGETFFVEGPYWPLNTTLFVSEFRGNHPKWVYYLLSTMPLDIDSAKSAVTGINRNVIGTLWAPKPPLEVQSHIAKHLDASHHTVSRLLDRIQHQIHLLIEHRQALITAAVTGALDVSEVAA